MEASFFLWEKKTQALQFSQRRGCPSLLLLATALRQNMALGFRPSSQQPGGRCTPSLLLQSEMLTTLEGRGLEQFISAGRCEQVTGMLENTGSPASCLSAGRRPGQLPPLTLFLKVSLGRQVSPPFPKTHSAVRQMLWPAGRQDFWEVPKERLHPCTPQHLAFPPNSCLNRLCQLRRSGCPTRGDTPRKCSTEPCGSTG